MSEHNITVEGGTSIRLPTAGKYCDRDILITATGVAVEGDPYSGEYTVTPKVEAQTMPTKSKLMLDDVTIEAIPYAEVSNSTNGKTITIG